MNEEPQNRPLELRSIWAATRSSLEADQFKHKLSGRKGKIHWTLFERLLSVFAFFLKVLNLYQWGLRNALHPIVHQVDLEFDRLPDAFDGYRILHLTDLHLDCAVGVEETIAEKIKQLHYDLCIITGDYREKTHGPFTQILQPLESLVRQIKAKDGILATLGNHDTYLMVNHLEGMGMCVLANETVKIQRKGETIDVTGLDDTIYYYTDHVLYALDQADGDFRMVITHSSEMYDVAAKKGYSLYLCGHTHGGQIALPGGLPIFTHQWKGKRFYRGLWRCAAMQGYTNQGCGASGIPIRFNTVNEIALITLNKRKRTKT